MKKIAIRIFVLLAVFLASVTATTFLTNSENTDNMGELDEASLPEILIDMDGNYVNPMYGYRQEMQVDFIRDSVTPIDTTRKIAVAVKPFDGDIKGLSYEIRTSDGSRVIENQRVKNLKESDGYYKATIVLTTENMLMGQEYSLRLTLDLAEGPVYYYTRVVQRARLNTSKYVDFVEGFYQKCLNKDTAAELSDYVESDPEASNSTFTNVTIKSSLDMISWGSLAPQISRKAVPIIKEINETTGSIVLKYQISAKDEANNQELYQVTDFYRMRYTQSRVMLLDFQRSASQVFDGSLPIVDSTGINLGMVNKNVPYVTNSSADIAAFVLNGDLWSYSHSASKITKIFSFRTASNSDERYDHGEHDMKILRVDESGDMDFVLFGYMNRGPHEGNEGIAVYHYSSARNAVKEQVFIPSTLSYAFLKRDLAKLSYVNEKNQMFIMTEGKLYQIDIQDQSYQTIQDNIDVDCFATCENGSKAAWMNEALLNGSETVTEMDLEENKIRSIQAEKGNYIKILGFMNDDLIYGTAKQKNVTIDSDGKAVFPMDEIKIEGFDGTVKKEYKKDGMYVTGVNLTDSLMEMQLSEKKGNVYTYKNSENIMNNKLAVAETVELNSVFTQRRGFTVRLDFNQKVSNPEPVVLFSKVQAMEEANILDMSIQPQENNVYYVYAFGNLNGVFADPALAVLSADAQNGVVLNRAQQYVWERGNKKTKVTLNNADIPDAMKKGTLDPLDLQDDLGEGYTVLNLTDCTLDSVLYEVSQQRPVIAATKNGKSVVIVGYDEYNTLIYNPEDGKTSYMGMNDSTKTFQEAGNKFYSYTENFK